MYFTAEQLVYFVRNNHYSELTNVCETTTSYLEHLASEEYNLIKPVYQVDCDLDIGNKLQSREIVILFEFLKRSKIFNLNILSNTASYNFLSKLTGLKPSTFKEYNVRSTDRSSGKQEYIEAFFCIPDSYGQINEMDKKIYKNVRDILSSFKNSELENLMQKFDAKIK